MFNALKYSQELEKAGFSREQAETSMKVLIDVMNDNFAMKSDMKEMETSIRSDMKEMETSIRSDMKEMETSIRSDMKEMETGLRSEIKEVRSDLKELEYRLTIKLSAVIVLALGAMATLIRIRPG